MPKISGLLNNCALYCALEKLLEGMAILADREREGTLVQLEESPIYASFETLKTCFATYYDLLPDPKTLSWQSLNHFLKRPPYLASFLAKEIIWAPVLRAFVKRHGATPPYYKIVDQTTCSAPELDLETREVAARSFGRYLSLEPDDAAKWCWNALGLSVEVKALPEGTTIVRVVSGDVTARNKQEIKLGHEIWVHSGTGVVYCTDVNGTVQERSDACEVIQGFFSSPAPGDYITDEDHLSTLGLLIGGRYNLVSPDGYETQRTYPVEGRHPFIPESSLTIYANARDKHYEVTDGRALEAATAEFSVERAQLPRELDRFFDGVTTHNEAGVTEGCLSDLKRFVRQQWFLVLSESEPRPLGGGANAHSSTEERLGQILSGHEDDPMYVSMIAAARKLIHEVNLLSNKNELINSILDLAEDPDNPVKQQTFQTLQKTVEGMGNAWQQVVSLMALFFGAVLIVAGIVGLAGTLGAGVIGAGAAIGVGVACAGLGAGFFIASEDKGLYKEMSDFETCVFSCM